MIGCEHRCLFLEKNIIFGKINYILLLTLKSKVLV